MAWTASWRVTGEKRVAHEMAWTSSKHFRKTSLGLPVRPPSNCQHIELSRSGVIENSPPPSLTLAATMQMTSTANGDRSCSAS